MDKLVLQTNQSILTLAYNLSGAVEAACAGRFIILVDVIDMSTTMEALREAGAIGLWGAAPVGKGEPYTNPFLIGRAAAKEAKAMQAELAVVSEPRVGTPQEREARAATVLKGIASEGITADGLWPNLGAETARYTDWRNKVVVVVSDAGGTIFDAVWQMGAKITTATVARTLMMKGSEPAIKGVERAIRMAGGAPLTLVAASSKAMEDVLAIQYLAHLILARLD